MRKVKRYVMDNFNCYNEEDYKLYNMFLSATKDTYIGIYQETFLKLIEYFKSDSYINHLMTFIVLVNINNNILGLDEEYIKDIVCGIEDVPCIEYQKYLSYLLSYENISGLESIHSLSKTKEIIPYQILKSMINQIDFDNDEDIILYNINKYYKDMYNVLNDNYKYTPWFNEQDDFNKIYSIILKNMEELNELSKLYKTGLIFSEEDFKTLQLLKRINRISLDKQEELLLLIKEYDLTLKPIQEKCEYILNMIKKYYELFKESDNIIYTNFKK